MLPKGMQVLAGKYRLIAPLKAGGMGKVWAAEHLDLRSSVAVKLLDEELAGTSHAVNRFLREARSAAQIRSPHIVQILDVGIDAGIPFIAMELLQGESLAERLARVGPLPPAEVTRLLSQVARGIGRAHAAGLVHRDLKPDNIFVERNEDDETVKVLDFGIAKELAPGFDPDSGATRTGTLIGSPHYMSPEQAEGASDLDHRTDIWSFGVVAFECLAGKRPFEQPSLGSQLLAICAWPLPVPSRLGAFPQGFDEWFARACARVPQERFASAQEAAQQLRTVCEGGAGVRPPVSSIPGRPPLVSRPAEPYAPRLLRLASEKLATVPVRARWALALALTIAIGVCILVLVTRDRGQIAAPVAPPVPRAPAGAAPPQPSATEAPRPIVVPIEEAAPLATPPASQTVPLRPPKLAPAPPPMPARRKWTNSPASAPPPEDAPFKEDPY